MNLLTKKQTADDGLQPTEICEYDVSLRTGGTVRLVECTGFDFKDGFALFYAPGRLLTAINKDAIIKIDPLHDTQAFV